jgi:hypothetical protein
MLAVTLLAVAPVTPARAGGNDLSFRLASDLPERVVIDRAFHGYARRFTRISRVQTRQTPTGPQLSSLELYGSPALTGDHRMCEVETLRATFEPVRGAPDSAVRLQGFSVQTRYHVYGPIEDFGARAVGDETTSARAIACAKLDPAQFFPSDGAAPSSLDLYLLTHPGNWFAPAPGLDLGSLDLRRLREISRTWWGGYTDDVFVFDAGKEDLVVREHRKNPTSEDRKLASPVLPIATTERRLRVDRANPSDGDFPPGQDDLPAMCSERLTLERVRHGPDATTIRQVFEQIACMVQHADRPAESNGMVYDGHILERLYFTTRPRRTAVGGFCAYDEVSLRFDGFDWLVAHRAFKKGMKEKQYIGVVVRPDQLGAQRYYRRMSDDCGSAIAGDGFFTADSAVDADRGVLALDRAAVALAKIDRRNWLGVSKLASVSLAQCPPESPCVRARFTVGGEIRSRPDDLVVTIPVRAIDDPTPVGEPTLEEFRGPLA